MTPTQANRELGQWHTFGSAKFWMAFFAIATFLLSAFFLVRYFTGGVINPLEWGLEDWINALSALGIAAALAGAKHMALSVDNSGVINGAMAILIVLAFANFGLFTEMSQSMEREGHTVRERSFDSPVMQATLVAIRKSSDSAGSSVNSYATQTAEAEGKAASHRSKAAECKGKYSTQKRIIKCEEYENAKAAEFQAQADHYKNAATSAGAAQKSHTENLISKGKELEFDEENHYEMIKFFKSFFGIEAISASFLFSLIIMGTFELGHWYTGRNCAWLKNIASGRIRYEEGRASEADIGTPVASTTPMNKTGTLDNLKTSFSQGANDVVDKAAYSAGNLAASIATHKPATSNFVPVEEWTKPQAKDQPIRDLTRERFFKLIYMEIRNRVINGDILPTIRPVTDAVTDVIRHHTKVLGLQPSLIGKPERQQIAEKVLDKLHAESVLDLNPDQGVGKPRYLLAEKWKNNPAPNIPLMEQALASQTVRQAMRHDENLYPGDRGLDSKTVAPAKPLPAMNQNELRRFVQSKRATIADNRFDQSFTDTANGTGPVGVGKFRKTYNVGQKFQVDVYQLLEAFGLIRPLDGGVYELTRKHDAQSIRSKLTVIRMLAGSFDKQGATA